MEIQQLPGGNEETTKNFIQDSRCPDRNPNRSRTEYKPRALLLIQPVRLLSCWFWFHVILIYFYFISTYFLRSLLAFRIILVIFYAVYIQSVPQRVVHSLTTCSWVHFESKTSNEHVSDLQRFVKEMRMGILLHL
jgi:hypothetical protein